MNSEDKQMCYIRPAYDANAPMEGYAKFQGLDCVFLIDATRRVSVHKLTVDNRPYKVALFAGTLEASDSDNAQSPVATAVIRDKHLNAYRLAFWEHFGEDEGDVYYVCRWTPQRVRKGAFIRPS